MSYHEKCRFCGLEIMPDPAAITAHFNSHWRLNNSDTIGLNSCAYEQSNNLRCGNPIHPEDIEVSSHFEQPFPYSYSPQTEPSNLTISGSRCSPLNLTGRTKASSPICLTTHNQNIAIHENNGDTLHNTNVYPMENIAVGNSLDLNNTIANPIDTNSQILDHLKKEKCHSLPTEFQCMICQKIFLTKSSLDEHSHIHLKNDPASNNQYVMCNTHVGVNESIDNSIPSISEKLYQCSICNDKFTYREELLDHLKGHESTKPYECDICGIRTSYLSALRRHRHTHTNEKQHKCTECGRSFYQKFDLQRHKNIHIKKHECFPCKKVFNSAHSLKKHKCTPLNEDSLKCSICDRGFTDNMAWSYHMWKHTKNAVFVPFLN